MFIYKHTVSYFFYFIKPSLYNIFTTFKGGDMGQILSEPVTTKHSTEDKDTRLMYGASSMQGWRISK